MDSKILSLSNQKDAINCIGGGFEKSRFGYQDQEFSFGWLQMLIIHSIEIMNGQLGMCMHNYKCGHR